jgi:LacI family transcriptional regulator
MILYGGLVDSDIPDPAPHPVTIYEVATAAGVSPSTVSRTFSRPGRVSVRTADHVRTIAQKLGYRDEAVFRPVVNSRTHVIALAVSDVTNPFYFGLLRGAEAAAAKAGYTILLLDAQESSDHERDNLARVLPLVDGLLVASSRMSDTVLRSIAKTHPLVVLNRHVAGLTCVVPDVKLGMRQAIAHLVSLGHTHLHYVAGPDASWMSGMRWMAIREAASDGSFTPHRVGPATPTVDGGKAAARLVADRRATAVLSYNDLTAMGLIQGLKTLGLRVPQDVSVLGFDNIFSSDLVTPSLTTIAAPMGKLGETAVAHIITMLSGSRTHTSGPITVPVRLIVRSSTGVAPGVEPNRRRGGSIPETPCKFLSHEPGASTMVPSGTTPGEPLPEAANGVLPTH